MRCNCAIRDVLEENKSEWECESWVPIINANQKSLLIYLDWIWQIIDYHITLKINKIEETSICAQGILKSHIT